MGGRGKGVKEKRDEEGKRLEDVAKMKQNRERESRKEREGDGLGERWRKGRERGVVKEMMRRGEKRRGKVTKG